MNRTTKLLLGGGAVVLVGGTIAAFTLGSGPSKKNGKGKSGSSKKPKRAVDKLEQLPVWRESDRPRAEELMRAEWQAMGQPTWSKEKSLELARRVAIKMYPEAEVTTQNNWPATDEASEAWINEGQQYKPFLGAKAWTKLKFMADSVMGYVPVT